jgi:putative membrane protein
VIVAGGALALAVFVQAFVRLRRRGRPDLAGLDRAALFVLGIAVVGVALLSPLDEVAERSRLSAHMLQHVLIGDVAPALLVVAIRGPLTFFLLPPAVLRRLARIRTLRSLLGLCLRPRVAFAIWVLALGLWHVPGAYDYALAHPLAHDAEHLSFMAGGMLVWMQLVDPARRRALGRSGRLAFACCLFVAGQVLAVILLLSAAPLYATYASLHDQQLAGLVMLVEQALSLGVCAAFLLRGLTISARLQGFPMVRSVPYRTGFD